MKNEELGNIFVVKTEEVKIDGLKMLRSQKMKIECEDGLPL